MRIYSNELIHNEVFHGPLVGAHLAENILFGKKVSCGQGRPRKLGRTLFWWLNVQDLVRVHLNENILLGKKVSYDQGWPGKLGRILFGWLNVQDLCKVSLNIRQNIHNLMVGTRGTLQNSTYSKTSICFKCDMLTFLFLITLY